MEQHHLKMTIIALLSSSSGQQSEIFPGSVKITEETTLSSQQHTSNPRNILTPWGDETILSIQFPCFPQLTSFFNTTRSQRTEVFHNPRCQFSSSIEQYKILHHHLSWFFKTTKDPYTVRIPVATSVKKNKIKKKKCYGNSQKSI